MTEQEQIEKNLSEAFHLMYDGLPEPVQLCHKTYRVVAVNPAGAASAAQAPRRAHSHRPAAPRRPGRHAPIHRRRDAPADGDGAARHPVP